MIAACAGGCRRSFANENDVLRARVLALEDEAALLRGRNAELESALAAQAARGHEGIAPEVASEIPYVVEIAIDRWSHARDEDGDGRADVIILYVVPADSRGRFVQLAGFLDAQAAMIPAGGDVRAIGAVALDPAAVRDAYRSSFTGTHYTLRLPVAVPADAPLEACDVTVVYRDGVTGARREAHRPIALAPAR
jgi:hypothetical protein